jgi:hypothetical protein
MDILAVHSWPRKWESLQPGGDEEGTEKDEAVAAEEVAEGLDAQGGGTQKKGLPKAA